MRIHALSVCVNYSHLFRGIDRWAQGCERFVVVTTPDDKATQYLCRFHNVETYITDVFFENGAAFNKAAGMAEAVMAKGLRENAEFLLTVDSDMYPPADWRQQIEKYDPKCGLLYGTKRYWVPTNATDAELVMDPKRQMPQRDVIGFFQLFHAADPRLPADPMFETFWAHAGWYDSNFGRRWEFPQFQRFLPFDLIHIGEERRNWLGIGKDKECEEMLRYGDRYSEKVVPPKLNPRRSQTMKPITPPPTVNLDEMMTPFVWHPVNYYWTDEADKAEVMAAYRTWDAMQANNRGFRNVFYERGAGPDAKLVDVLDLACKDARDNDVILFADRKAAICQRYLDQAQAMKVDAIAPLPDSEVVSLRVSWWKKNKHNFLDQLMEDATNPDLQPA